MRLRIDVRTRADHIPWHNVLRPGRGLLYTLTNTTKPELGEQLHNDGWGPHGMVPLGHGAPIFPRARRQRGKYAAGGRGHLQIGSPLPGVVQHWAEALADQSLLDWGGIALEIVGITALTPPAFSDGMATFRTATPLTIKALPNSGNRLRRPGTEILPHETGFLQALQHNLRRKAETLDLEPDITADSPTWIGAKRSYTIGQGSRTGAPVEITLHGAPRTLRALWSWGLGQANAAGFGWIKN